MRDDELGGELFLRGLGFDSAFTLDLSRIELKATKDGYPLYQKLGFRDSSKEYPLMKWVYR